MDVGSKVSNSSGLWPCIGLTALNSVAFGRKPIQIPANQNQRTGCDLQGSVPSTPVSDCEEIDDYTPDYNLQMDIKNIIDCFLKEFTGLSHSKCAKTKVLSTMKRVVDSLLVKHEITYKAMIGRLNLDETEDLSFITAVAQDLFSDGVTNWGRISSLLAFGAMLSKHLNDKGRSHCVSMVGDKISSYLIAEQKDWLLRNNSWDGFVEFFHVPDTEAAVRNTLMAIGSVATFGAALAYLIR